MDLTTKLELMQIWLGVLTIVLVIVVCYLGHIQDVFKTKHRMDKRLLQTQMENLQSAVDHLTKCNGSNYQQIERIKVRTSLLEAALVQAALEGEEPEEPEEPKCLVTIQDQNGDNVFEEYVTADTAHTLQGLLDEETPPESDEGMEGVNALLAAASVVNGSGKDANKVQES